MKRTIYQDITDQAEDDRIKTIANAARHSMNPVGFVTDMDPPEKADRYVRKLEQRGCVEVGERLTTTRRQTPLPCS